MIMRSSQISSGFTDGVFDPRGKVVTIDSDIMMILNEYVIVTRAKSTGDTTSDIKTERLTIVPINYT